MNKVLIITGPTGAGKNTVGDEVANQLKSCSIIDTDLIRAMFTKPHHTPWDGQEGMHQNEVMTELAVLIAKRMADDGRVPIILDVVTPDNDAQYHKLLDNNVFVVLLLPTWAEVQARNAERASVEGHVRLNRPQLEEVYLSQQENMSYDLLIDNTELAPAEAAEKIISSFNFLSSQP